MKLWTALALAAALAACATPRVTSPITQDMLTYSNEVATAQQRQLLLNIVKLRYNDPVSFVEIQTLTTEDFSGRGGSLASAIGLDDGPFTEILSGDAGFQRSETPTAVYNVLRGSAYAEQLLQPVAPESIFLLSQSGWSVERLMLCCVARIGDVDNARAAAGPTPETLPDNSAFRDLARLMRRLQLSGDLLVQVMNDEEDKAARVVVTWHAGTRDGEALARIFKEHKAAAEFVTEDRLYSAELATRSTRKGDSPLRGRSVLGMMAALSHAVDIPPAHQDFVIAINGPEGTPTPCSPVDVWTHVLGDYFGVSWSLEKPVSAAVSVPYRGVWFYIDDTCKSAKSTLDLIGHLYALQAGLSTAGSRDTLLLIGG
ncbi:MAG: hypothetical protein ACK4Y9_14005 [Hyphomonas sp.]